MAPLDVLRMAMHARLLRLALITLPLILLAPSAAWADSPLTSQVVDAETGQPLEGVVVLAYWLRYSASVGGWADARFSDAEEVVTGPDGRYTIQPRFTYTILLITQVSFEGLVIFKPGYGLGERRPSGDTEVIALPPLKTREERLTALGRIGDPGLVPLDYKKRLEEAILRERAYLGLH